MIFHNCQKKHHHDIMLLKCSHSLISVCHPSNFTCDNGRCIIHDLECNGINDCGDYSDEKNCSEWTGNCSIGSYHRCIKYLLDLIEALLVVWCWN